PRDRLRCLPDPLQFDEAGYLPHGASGDLTRLGGSCDPRSGALRKHLGESALVLVGKYFDELRALVSPIVEQREGQRRSRIAQMLFDQRARERLIATVEMQKPAFARRRKLRFDAGRRDDRT